MSPGVRRSGSRTRASRSTSTAPTSTRSSRVGPQAAYGERWGALMCVYATIRRRFYVFDSLDLITSTGFYAHPVRAWWLPWSAAGLEPGLRRMLGIAPADGTQSGLSRGVWFRELWWSCGCLRLFIAALVVNAVQMGEQWHRRQRTLQIHRQASAPPSSPSRWVS